MVMGHEFGGRVVSTGTLDLETGRVVVQPVVGVGGAPTAGMARRTSARSVN
jgi:threonine dehydrogenase-like Zn-dependent dehydrogenase